MRRAKCMIKFAATAAPAACFSVGARQPHPLGTQSERELNLAPSCGADTVDTATASVHPPRCGQVIRARFRMPLASQRCSSRRPAGQQVSEERTCASASVWRGRASECTAQARLPRAIPCLPVRQCPLVLYRRCTGGGKKLLARGSAAAARSRRQRRWCHHWWWRGTASEADTLASTRSSGQLGSSLSALQRRGRRKGRRLQRHECS